jgi:hypothetical protein
LVDDTNMPGVYRFDIPDAAVAAGVDVVTIGLVVAGASNAVAAPLMVHIMDNIVDGVWDEVLSGAAHNVTNSAGRRLRFLQEAGTYAGAIWIDTVNGTAGTTDFENGTDSNPVDSIADANTLATSLGISRFQIAPGSSITLAASQQNQIFDGRSWTLALGSQNIDGSTFIGANVSGVGTNTSGEQWFIDCDFGATTVPGGTHTLRCAHSGTVTLGEADDYWFEGGYSSVAGTGTPTLDFGGALNASNVSMRHYSGGIEIQNMGAGTGSYNMSLEGNGQLVINANCSATSTVAIRGNFTVTDNASGAVTLSDDARYDAFRHPTPLAEGTAQAGAAGTITLASDESSTTDWFEGKAVEVYSGTGAGQVGVVHDYNGTTKVASVAPNWKTNPDSTSKYRIWDARSVLTLCGGAGPSIVNAGFGGSIPADIQHIDNDATAADNMEAFFDDTGFAATNSTVGTVTTLTGHTAQTGDNFARLGAPAGASVSADVAAVKAETALIVADTNELQTDDVPGLIAALNDISVADILTTQMTEAYAADGAAPTLAQALMMIQQMLGDFTISGTTMTVRKVDGATAAATFTLNDGSNPTALTRAT